MTFWQRWRERPQSLWLRKALFQLHLWTGIGLGLYVFLVSVSGSALVFRNSIYTRFAPKPRTVAVAGALLPHAKLRAAAEDVHPGYRVSYIWDAKKPDLAIEVWLERRGHYMQRLFDPYTGRDLGPSVPAVLRAADWLQKLHVSLLSGDPGRALNGYLAIPFTLLVLTGAVVWWPGMQNWRRHTRVRRNVGWKRFTWDLHSAIGFWTCAFSLMWGVTGVYVVFPWPFQRLVGLFLTPDLFNPRRSPDQRLLLWLTRLHFGNFSQWPLKALWVAIGLAPAALFLTGLVMWWNRVILRAWRQTRERRELAPALRES